MPMRNRIRTDCAIAAFTGLRNWILACAAVSAASLAFGRLALAFDHPAAVDAFQALQQSLVHDKAQRNWAAYLEDAQRLKVFLNGSPLSGLEVARAQLQLGRAQEALRETRRFLAMGQTNGILAGALFEPLRSQIDVLERENQVSIAAANAGAELVDSQLLPEDIDYDLQSKQFFISSILEKKVIVFDGLGQQRTFADAPDRWPMLALKIDAKRRRLWVTEAALDEFTAVPASDWGRSVILEYDLDRGTLLSRHDGPPHGNLGDMVLAGNGDPIVSDGTGGGIYRLHDHELRRIDHGDFVSPQTIAICGQGGRAFVPDYVRGIAMLDLQTGAARWLSMKDQYALDGIDGLYCDGRLLIAVQNGVTPQRVVAFALDESGSAIVGQTIIERETSRLGVPTHGVFVGRTFYFLANSGWDALDEHGALKAAVRLTKASVLSIDESRIVAKLRH
jgi:hypothetical protein